MRRIGRNESSLNDQLFDIANYVILTLAVLAVLYPLYYVVIASISDPNYIAAGKVFIRPMGITFEGYTEIFKSPEIWSGYKNTIIYTVFGTVISVCFTLPAGYALTKRDLPGKKLIMIFLMFTMYFSGGLIPTYVLINELNMLNTMWAIVIPNAVWIFNIIIVRTFMQQNISKEMIEAAKIDGCSQALIFFKIVLPLSKAVTVILILFHAIGYWNSFFDAMIYLDDKKMHPLQLVLRDILIQNQVSNNSMESIDTFIAKQRLADLLKYGSIIVASLPVLILYPFLQKYFVKGVTIGSVKG